MGFKAVNEVAAARQAKKQRAAFYTPLELVEMMVDSAGVSEYSRCLEPSAGDGRIVHALSEHGVTEIDACEIEPSLHHAIRAVGGKMIGGDFLDIAAAPPFYDAIVMNPPFKGKEWLKHVQHAWTFLKRGGRLVAVVPGIAANDLVFGEIELPGCDLCSFEPIDPKAFKDYETNVATLMFTANKDDGSKHHQVEGFSNHVTHCAAIAIGSNSGIYALRGELSNGDIRRKHLEEVVKIGGHCDYGIKWEEVYGYLRIDLWGADGKVSGEGVGKG